MYLPLRPAVDREVVCEGLRDSTIDAIATDHVPHAPDLREWPFDDGVRRNAWPRNGALAGVDRAWFAGRASARAWWSVAVGHDADLVVIDPEATWAVDRLALVSKAHNTLY